jgi:hypothetical protein
MVLFSVAVILKQPKQRLLELSNMSLKRFIFFLVFKVIFVDVAKFGGDEEMITVVVFHGLKLFAIQFQLFDMLKIENH